MPGLVVPGGGQAVTGPSGGQGQLGPGVGALLLHQRLPGQGEERTLHGRHVLQQQRRGHHRSGAGADSAANGLVFHRRDTQLPKPDQQRPDRLSGIHIYTLQYFPYS